MEYTHGYENRSLISVHAGNSSWEYRFSVESLRDRDHFLLKIPISSFVSVSNEIKYYFDNSNKLFWVAAKSAGRSLEGQHRIFNFRPYNHVYIILVCCNATSLNITKTCLT